MKKLKSIAAAAVLVSDPSYSAVVEYTDYSLFLGSGVDLNITDFDSLPSGTILTGNEFADFTITGRSITVVNPQNFAPGLAVGGANVNSQPNGISVSLTYNTSGNIVFDNLDDNFNFELTSPGNAAGLWVGNLGASNNDPNTETIVSFFDSFGGLIASEALTQATLGLIGSGANNRVFYGITSDIGIASFTVQNASFDGDGIVLDDVQVSPVPLPTTALLFASGFSFLALFRRRRAKV